MEFPKYTEMEIKDIRLIKNLYWDQRAVVRLQAENSEEFSIERGARQRCVLSPKLFNLHIDPILRSIEDLPGFTIRGENLINFRYADTALVAGSEEKLQKIVNKVNEQSVSLVLYMDVNKTKTTRVNKAGETRNVATNVEGQDLEQVRKFKYLGQIITDDSRRGKGIKRRIAIARCNFISIKDVLATRKLKCMGYKNETDEMLYTINISMCFRDLGTNAETEKRISSLEMWIYRRMLKISYQQHIISGIS